MNKRKFSEAVTCVEAKRHNSSMKKNTSLFLLGSCLIFGANCYAADAAWWTEADKRIEEYRKAPLHVTVIDQQGKKVAGAEVRVAMTRHAFEFGSAVKVAAINDPKQEDYRQKILELFNSGTFENALKVKAWSGDFGPAVGPEATVQALHWTHENRIKIRGHAMTGNSIRRSSKAFVKLHEEGGKPAIMEAVMKSIDDKAAQTGFAIDEWDVVNHPVGIQRPGREAAGAGNSPPPGQVFGIEESIGWFERSRANLPEGRLYLNESGVLPSPEDDSPQVQKYLTWINHVNASGLLDGVGLQAHFRGDPDIISIEGRLNKIAAVGLPIRITEFTLNGSDEEKQGQFTREFMTLVFSHPSVVGFQCWGFWEGAIFQPEVAMFRKDWSAKPNGVVYQDLVFEKWWTDESGRTDRAGDYQTSAFLGEYEISVSTGGKTVMKTHILDKTGETLVIQLD